MGFVQRVLIRALAFRVLAVLAVAFQKHCDPHWAQKRNLRIGIQRYKFMDFYFYKYDRQ